MKYVIPLVLVLVVLLAILLGGGSGAPRDGAGNGAGNGARDGAARSSTEGAESSSKLADSGPVPSDADATAKELVIISPHSAEIQAEYSRAFRAWMRSEHGQEVTIRWLDVGGTSKVLKDLETRFATNPDRPGVDLLFGGGVDPYLRGMREGWLEPTPVAQAILAGIPPRAAGFPTYDPEGHWYGVAMSGFGIIYNKPLLKKLSLPTPTAWEDLARPDFQSWVGSGDPRSSGSVHMCYEIILQTHGWEKGWGAILRLCANVRRFGEGGGAAPREVAAGENAAGMVIDMYALQVIQELGPEAVGFVLPAGATVINPDAIGRVKGAAEPELAARFIAFALSEPGQRILFQPAGVNGQGKPLHRMPVRAALYTDPDAPPTDPFAFEQGFQYDGDLGSRRWRLVNELIGAWCIETHPDLTAAWTAIKDKPAGDPLVRALTAPPIPEAEVETAIAAMGDSRARLEATAAWTRAARERYRSIHERAR